MADDQTFPFSGVPGAAGRPLPAPGRSPDVDEALVTTARGVDSWLTPEFMAAINQPGRQPAPGAAAPTSGSYNASAAAAASGLPGSPRPATAGAHKPMSRSDIDSLVGRWMSQPVPTPAPITAPPPLTRPTPSVPSAPVVPPTMPAFPASPFAPAAEPSARGPLSVTLPAMPPAARAPEPPRPRQIEYTIPALNPPVTPPPTAYTPAVTREPWMPAPAVPPTPTPTPPTSRPGLGDLDQFLALSRIDTPIVPVVPAREPAPAAPAPAPAPVVATPVPEPTTPAPALTEPVLPTSAIVDTTPQAIVIDDSIKPATKAPKEPEKIPEPKPEPAVESKPEPTPEPEAETPPLSEAERRAAERVARQAASMRAAYERQVALGVGLAPPSEAKPRTDVKLLREGKSEQAHPDFAPPGTVSARQPDETTPAEPVPLVKPGRQPKAAKVDLPVRDGPRISFGNAVGRTFLSTLLPGAGLFKSHRTRNWVLGLVLLVLVLGLVGVALYAVFFNRPLLTSTILSPSRTRLVAYALIGLAVIWVLAISLTMILTHTPPWSAGKRIAGGLIALALSLVVAAPLALGAVYARTTAATIDAIFADKESQTRPEDPPANAPLGTDGRLNILLAGLAPEAGDPQSVRAETLIVASIDVESGNTVLFGIPSFMARTPFPAGSDLAAAWPTGFYDGADPANPAYFVSGIWSGAPTDKPDLFGRTDYPGADATKLAVGTALGLPIHYFISVGVDQIEPLVNAIGGVSVNVNFDIGMGVAADAQACTAFDTLSKGKDQTLNGKQAFWFATSTCNDLAGEYGRLIRQQCLVGAVLDQATPRTVLMSFRQIMAALGDMAESDIPPSLLPRFNELMDTVRGGSVLRYNLTHGRNGFNAANPNYRLVATQVAAVINQSTKPDSATAQPGTDVSNDICGYDPREG